MSSSVLFKKFYNLGLRRRRKNIARENKGSSKQGNQA
jgi:hypothetical protein